MKVTEIKKAVSGLPVRDLAEFRSWFEEFDAAAWDNELEKDIAAGRLDSLAGKAIQDFKQGSFREL
jgi:hypothetical protein